MMQVVVGGDGRLYIVIIPVQHINISNASGHHHQQQIPSLSAGVQVIPLPITASETSFNTDALQNASNIGNLLMSMTANPSILSNPALLAENPIFLQQALAALVQQPMATSLGVSVQGEARPTGTGLEELAIGQQPPLQQETPQNSNSGRPHSVSSSQISSVPQGAGGERSTSSAASTSNGGSSDSSDPAATTHHPAADQPQSMSISSRTTATSSHLPMLPHHSALASPPRQPLASGAAGIVSTGNKEEGLQVDDSTGNTNPDDEEGIVSGRPPVSLYMPCDDQCLSRYQCLIRQQIELFQATHADLDTNTQGRNRPIVLGQVGIRCRHCASSPNKLRKAGAVYFPSKVRNKTNNLTVTVSVAVPSDSVSIGVVTEDKVIEGKPL